MNNKPKEVIKKGNEPQDAIVTQILEIIDSIRPYIQMDGGDINFIKYEEGYVYIRLTGACQDCGMLDTTINDGLAATLQSEIPEIKGVINVEI